MDELRINIKLRQIHNLHTFAKITNVYDWHGTFTQTNLKSFKRKQNKKITVLKSV